MNARCLVCVSPAIVVDDRVQLAHLTWCPRWRAPRRDALLLTPAPYAEPLSAEELDTLDQDEVTL